MFETAEERREREALAWVQVLNAESVSDEEMDAYLSWMEADTMNAQAFRDLDAAWIAAGDARDSIRARFGPEARENGVSKSFWPSTLAPAWRAQVVVVCGVLLLAVLFLLPVEDVNIDSIQFATAIGERRDVTLEDGSTVTLNTGSMIDVSFQKTRRIVSLSRGGALFDVQPDSARPFIVRMDGGAVEVLGTIFDVLRQQNGFAVTVLEGRVSVSADVDGPVPNKAVVLTPNQGANVNTEVVAITSYAVDAAEAASWRRGQLIYKDASLGKVLEDLNRYSETTISVQSPDLEALTFTGVLAIESADIMTQRLAGLLELSVVTEEGGGLRLQARP
ncbi:MAG: FecR domain-containing protein [Rhodospirillaceae bacterium]